MLPKPRNASLKETNRILLPHTLTKKPAPSKTARNPDAKPKPIQSKPTTGLASSYDSDDDDDEDDAGTSSSSFFSFGESSKAVSGPASTTVLKPQTTNLMSKFNPKLTSITPGPVVNEPISQTKPQPVLTSPKMVNPGLPAQHDSTPPLIFGPSISQDSPLAFKPSNPPSSQDAPLVFSKPTNPSAQYSHHASQYVESQMYTAPYGYETEYTEYNQPYLEQDPPAYGEGQGVDSGEEQGVDSREGQSAEVLSDLAADKEFQRLMGKRNVSRESINMVEIAADEQIGPANHLDWMKKNLTEEKEYRAKLRKEQLPSGQQKRKHQITFLAHQAKERELELKNQWANNQQTRKHTQMKYGF